MALFLSRKYRGLTPSFVIGISVTLAAILLGSGVWNTEYAMRIVGQCIYCGSILLVAFAGAWFATVQVLCHGKWRVVKHKRIDTKLTSEFIKEMVNGRSAFTPCERKVVTSANLDQEMQAILDLVTRDFVMSWYYQLGRDYDRFGHHFQDFIWVMIEEFTNRLQQTDFFMFATQKIIGILTKHLEDVRKARAKPKDGQPRMKFKLYSWLESEENELEFLRRTAEFFLIHLLPKEYADNQPVRHLCREILACSVFKPSIEIICDPDYFNQKTLSWLSYRKELALEHKNTYTYAATYEKFMQMLEGCNDIEHLKQMRYNIISEIMQATTINNLKRAQGIDVDDETSPKGHSKGDLLKARNLKIYINQLTVSKSYCEKKIHTLGGPDYKSYRSDLESPRHSELPGRKVLAFPVIMEDCEARDAMASFLKRTEKDGLMKFWVAIDSMKNQERSSWHQLAGNIYQLFITPSSNCVKLHLDKRTMKSMESFMLGDSGPGGFWEAQERIYEILEEQHYASFILSDIFHQFMVMKSKVLTSGQSTDQIVQGSSPNSIKEKSSIAAHSTYAQDKLHKKKDKLDNKKMALKALKAGLKMDDKVKKIQEDIEKEIQDLKSEVRQLEFHIERTDCWTGLIGKWKARVCNAEILFEDGKMVTYFIIVVHQDGIMSPPVTSNTTQGWVIHRQLEACHALQKEVVSIQPSFKKLELPSVSKLKGRSVDTVILEKAKEQIQTFLSEVLDDDRLSQSEMIYMFFSPSPEHLKQNQGMQKSKGSFTNLFKQVQIKSDSDSDGEDLVFSGEEFKKSKRTSEHIVEPMYQLISEIFELKGMFKWMRRTLMSFVQVTFGRSIHKQLRATVEWTYSESMLVFYLNQYREAYWPNGIKAGVTPNRTVKEKAMTKSQARAILSKSIPDALKNLVGETNSKHGAVKLFDSFQDLRSNKHLFYCLLQEFMLVTFPELKVFRELMSNDGNSSHD